MTHPRTDPAIGGGTAEVSQSIIAAAPAVASATPECRRGGRDR